MNMRTAFEWGLGLSLSFISMTTVGCYIETGDDCDWSDDCIDQPGAPDAPDFERPDPDEDTDGEDGASSSGGESSASGGESSASGGGESSPGTPGACQASCDCPSGDVCVEGTCKTPCAASCECPEGDSCEGGYCAPPPEPAISCEANCDCPSGSECVEGVCS
ncbi:hypothetical protein [Sorangium atrum]|uniref:Dumpy n=2 Tax=Sorangium TaxID=39643 RepID=A0ABT5BRC9_9BACT|nr:hypothetical protein [Sorangium aterium]MDC0676647.1 hypothetical protein [Sorangium aterium]